MSQPDCYSPSGEISPHTWSVSRALLSLSIEVCPERGSLW